MDNSYNVQLVLTHLGAMTHIFVLPDVFITPF